jgi:hypothetical protein
LASFLQVSHRRSSHLNSIRPSPPSIYHLHDTKKLLRTPSAITLGASTADIIRAYGEPDSKQTNMGSTFLDYGKLNAQFTLVGDKLVGMTFNRPRPTK